MKINIRRNIGLLLECINIRKLRFKPVLDNSFAKTIRNAAVMYSNPVTIEFGFAYFDNNRCQRFPKLASFDSHMKDLSKATTHYEKRGEKRNDFNYMDKKIYNYHTSTIKKHGKQISNKSVVSFAGTIIHELSHSRLGTDDLNLKAYIDDSSNAIDKLFGTKGYLAYGQYFCHRLAQQNSKAAQNNADNYRLFCESFLSKKSVFN